MWDVNVCRTHTHIRRSIHAIARIASAVCMWWWQTSLVLATPRHSRLAAIVARMSCHKTRQEESKMYFFSLSFFPMEKCVIYCCRMHLRKCTTAQATCRCPSPCNLVALRKTMRHFKEEKRRAGDFVFTYMLLQRGLNKSYKWWSHAQRCIHT